MSREQQLPEVSRNNAACGVLQVIVQTPDFISHLLRQFRILFFSPTRPARTAYFKVQFSFHKYGRKKISDGKLQNPAGLSHFSLYVTRRELIPAPFFNKVTVFYAIQKRPGEGFPLTSRFIQLKVFYVIFHRGGKLAPRISVRLCKSRSLFSYRLSPD